MVLQGKTLITSVKTIVCIAEKMRAAYFFTPPCNANGRRRYEMENSFPKVEWFDGGHEYTAEYSVRCSCNNVYAKGHYTKDGRKTNLKAIRNSLKRLEAA